MSECDREFSTMGKPWLTRDYSAMVKKRRRIDAKESRSILIKLSCPNLLGGSDEIHEHFQSAEKRECFVLGWPWKQVTESCSIRYKPVPWIRRLLAGLSPYTPRFDPIPVLV